MTDNVIELKTRMQEAPPIDPRRQRYDECKHAHTVIDGVLRTIACSDCGQERLDPIEVLIGLSATWQRWKNEHERLTDLRKKDFEERKKRWETQRDRHLNANPGHALRTDGSYVRGRGDCLMCFRIASRGHSFMPREVRDRSGLL